MHSSVICYCIRPQQNGIYLFYMEKNAVGSEIFYASVRTNQNV